MNALQKAAKDYASTYPTGVAQTEAERNFLAGATWAVAAAAKEVGQLNSAGPMNLVLDLLEDE